MWVAARGSTAFGGVRPSQDVADALAGQAGHAGPRRDSCTADVGEQRGPRRSQQPGVHRRLAVEDVEARGEDGAGLQGVDQRVLVDHRAAGGVDEDCRRLHERQLRRADEVAGGLVERNMQAHDVGSLRAVRRASGRSRGRSGVVPRRVDDLHVEAARPLRHGSCDAAEADQSEGRAVHVAGQVGAEAPSPPSALPQVALGIGRQPRGRQDQEEREIGRGVVEHARRVAHRDAQGSAPSATSMLS